jgi:HJR/Mrr/RecB family endonuclease
MRRSNRRLVKSLLTAIAQTASESTSANSHHLYSILPADLDAADTDYRRLEQEWRRAGAARVTDEDVAKVRDKAKELQREFDQVMHQSRFGFMLLYLHLVRLFVLSRLPVFGKVVVIGSFVAAICAFSMILSPFVFPTIGAAVQGVLVITSLGGGLVTTVVFLLWPTEHKRQSFQRLHSQRQERKARIETLRLPLAHAWREYKELRNQRLLCAQMESAKKYRDEIAAILATEIYQLIHSNWRALRGEEFEQFLFRVFVMLGYQVKLTKRSHDQGVDLVVIGKGKTIAVQAKGHESSVGNHAVGEVVAGMSYHRCDACVVITNSYFTPTAKKLAIANDCRLIDGSEIPKLIEGAIY